ncbi:XRE family transcriptional regulator [Chryseobacterium joostei]|uniref:Helix-turn-helix domain-containing protein n=1 Tax=Chryseobacterium joostei TaxID=112234 RepID=A0A1N7I745_9FLAO|nr:MULTISPECIES: helix-turn-helix transcriptional regulator [Chryseobacterium]AZB00733.1 XRE family transcriptional regulator [Chryseobacterium joostei]SIS32903.1 Helix-turn-helix domain-containing protein [Chryseobacterium joostei]HCM34857.1 XRE family transcriptional regulator [Chryseobacterium sp.]
MKVMFGEYIRELRTNNHLTLTQLAARLELDSANLSKIENGKRDFDERRLEKLADVFNLDIEKLKVEYFGDQFAKKMFKYNCLPEALNVAKEKINYMRNMNVKQTEIEF